MNEECQKKLADINTYLSKSCKKNTNTLNSCEEKTGCSCSPSDDSSKDKVDLIILVDSSGSMSTTWSAILDSTANLDDVIKGKCGAETRITKLSLDNSDDANNPGTYSVPGYINHEDYLRNTAGYSGPLFTNSDKGADVEQGGKAVADLSNYFDWQPDHCRSILYISDEWLDSTFLTTNGGLTLETASAMAATIGSSVAIANSVTVFTHLVNSGFGSQSSPANHPAIENHYKDLAESTGGNAHIGDKPTPELYEKLISDAVCDCGKGCKTITQSEIKPCISISWGDSNCDSLETDDFEKLCITVCNCYSNVAFCDFNIFQLEVTDSDGCPVALLPNGTPSVDIVPVGPFCFGDIKPCIEGEASCVSREFVLNTCGAKEGEYQIKLGSICFEVKHTYTEEACFKFKLCKS